MKIYKFIVPVRGVVSMEVEAESEVEAKKKIIEGSKGIYEGIAEIDTWYTEKAELAED